MKQPLFSTSYAPRDGESTLDEIETEASSPQEFDFAYQKAQAFLKGV